MKWITIFSVIVMALCPFRAIYADSQEHLSMEPAPSQIKSPLAPLPQEQLREDRTRSWLAIQRSNTQATHYQDSLSPHMAQSVQKRAEQSFSHEVPETFIDKSFGE